MRAEINRQIVERDKAYTNDYDACILWVLHTHLGFGPKRLRRFFDAYREEHQRLRDFYMMAEDTGWLCREKLKQIGVDIAAWNEEEKT